MYLVEHLLQVLLGVDPGGNGITEEDKVLHYSTRVHADHVADPTERRVLLFVVTDVAQRDAPVVVCAYACVQAIECKLSFVFIVNACV